MGAVWYRGGRVNYVASLAGVWFCIRNPAGRLTAPSVCAVSWHCSHRRHSPHHRHRCFAHRLFDIDVLINRTLVYGGLTAVTIGVYVLLVGGVGSLLQVQGRSAVAFVATGVVAVLFQSLRVRLQTAVDHLMYGHRDDPVGMLTHLAQQLEMVDSPDRILPTLVETIATALKLPHASLWLPKDETKWEPMAVFGPQADDLLMVSLLHQNQEVGRLFVAPRGPGERFSQEDERLLAAVGTTVGDDSAGGAAFRGAAAVAAAVGDQP